jgi:hypothetical protein
MSRPRILWLTFALALAAAAQAGRGVDDLVAFVKSAIQLKQPDKAVAEEVAKIRLANRLDGATVDQLQRSGAGPKTVAALRRLVEATASLPAQQASARPAAGAAAEAIPPPEPAEWNEAIAGIRTNALDYTRNLPNYICVQQTKRRVDPTGAGSWTLADTIVEQLNYFEQKETYKVLQVNDRPMPPNTRQDQLGGAKSTGEFGSILRTIFDPETGTEFRFERWATLGGRRAYVAAFRVPRPAYGIRHELSKQSITVGFHGLIFADRDTRTVRRVQMECDDIPADFPIRAVSLQLDYADAEIAGQNYLLPLESSIRSREGKAASWNEVTYHGYRKFGTDVNITFDAPDDAPKKK